MPESVTDRPTKSHEYVFLLSKSPKYYYDYEAIKEPAAKAYDPKHKVIRRDAKKLGWSRSQMNTGNPQASPTGRNKRDVWTITKQPFRGAHFAVMPEALVEPCVLAGSAEGDTVLDPFTGSGTVAVVANRHGRNFVGTELNPEYAEIAKERIINSAPMFNQVEVQ
jgi:DNA modification methylase